MKYEVCVDNINSVKIASTAQVNRLELCSALALGGLTPSYAFIRASLQFNNLAHYVMIRPRAGHFVFDKEDISLMLADIEMAKSLGAHGIVIGALKPNREIDIKTCERLIKAADGMGVTFHRAFDLCSDTKTALEQIIDLGCERLLTSGQEKNAWLGRAKIAQLAAQADERISIMPGAGINSSNALEIVEVTGVNEIHFSAKTVQKNEIPRINVSMGINSDTDNQITQTNLDEVLSIKKQFNH